jgi:hypothetical protein
VARAGADELSETADRLDASPLRALATDAQAAVLLLEGDARAALGARSLARISTAIGLLLTSQLQRWRPERNSRRWVLVSTLMLCSPAVASSSRNRSGSSELEGQRGED